jgi:HAE1 family hydrophobic/amphiphilic exporter-1
MSSSQAPLLYAFSIIVIFLCVAALYESWPIPIANLLMLPIGVFGAALATWSRGLHNDVYFQIGFLTTLGLTTKNAILIIQFAKERIARGEKLMEATLGAVRVRFRPVIMTSMAFFFGVLPLAIATGAGAGAMNAIGTAVTGGMLSATFIDLFYIPLLFVVVSQLFKAGKQPRSPDNGTNSIPSSEGSPATLPSPGMPDERERKANPNNTSEGRQL